MSNTLHILNLLFNLETLDSLIWHHRWLPLYKCVVYNNNWIASGLLYATNLFQKNRENIVEITRCKIFLSLFRVLFHYFFHFFNIFYFNTNYDTIQYEEWYNKIWKIRKMKKYDTCISQLDTIYHHFWH